MGDKAQESLLQVGPFPACMFAGKWALACALNEQTSKHSELGPPFVNPAFHPFLKEFGCCHCFWPECGPTLASARLPSLPLGISAHPQL